MRIGLAISAIMAAAAHGALFYIEPDQTIFPVQTAGAFEENYFEIPPIDIFCGGLDDEEIPPKEDIRSVRERIRPLPVVFGRLVAIVTPDIVPMHFVPRFEPPKHANGAPVSIVSKNDFIKAAMQVESRAILGVESLDNQPRARHQVAPHYVYTSEKRWLSGEVMVNLIVDENGKVISAKVISSTHSDLEEPALRAVSKWRFEPGRKNGKKVSFQMNVPIRFSLNDTD